MLIRLTRLLNSPDESKTSKNLVTSLQVRSFMSTLSQTGGASVLSVCVSLS